MPGCEMEQFLMSTRKPRQKMNEIRSKIKFLTAVIFVFIIRPAGAFDNNQASARGLALVIGYLTAQKMTLEVIKKTYPELSPYVHIAELEFESRFPDTFNKANSIINEIFPKEDAARVQQIRDNLKSSVDTAITRDTALQFISTVGKRAQGSIEKPELMRFLYAISYYENPTQELEKTKPSRFSTKGEEKAKGVEVSLVLPLSWEERSGSTPNAVRIWISEGGGGNAVISLLIQDNNDNRSERDITRDIASKKPGVLFPSNASVSQLIPIEMDSRPGWLYKAELLVTRLDINLLMFIKSLNLLYNGKTVQINCSRTGLADKRDAIAKDFNRIEPVCDLVFNSLVIDSVYK